MTVATALAAAAGAVAVAALADLVALVQAGDLGRLAARALAPWRAAARTPGAVSDEERRRLAIVCGVTLAAGAWLVAGAVVAVLSAVCGPWAARRVLEERRARWRARLHEGVPITARALADALSGGHALRGAVVQAAASGSVGGAAGAELRTLARELELGRPTAAALEDWRSRAASPGTDVLVAAMLLQQESGGDLAGLLRELAADLEEGRRATADARTATAQARLTARLVAGLPVAALAITELAAPGSVAAVLAEPLPRVMAATAVVLVAAALVAVRRLAQVPA